jgi:pilus assembly protein CpaF
MVTLLLTEKGGDSKQLTFDKDEVTLGRVQGNDIVLPKGNVSKRHCRILAHNGRYSVEDLKSTNGTYINGRKIAETTLVSGADKIYVGDYIVKVEGAIDLGPPAAPEAGSLSTALPRRPPPPPAPGRPTTAMSSVDDDDEGLDLGRRLRGSPPPPPPLGGGRRDTARPQPAIGDDLGGLDGMDSLDLAPPSPADVEVDEEALAPRPRLPMPPLKSPLPSLADDSDIEPDEVSDIRNDMKTQRPERLLSPPGWSASNSHDGATWLRHLLDSDGATAVYVSGAKVEVERRGHREAADVPAGASLPEALRSIASRGSPRPSGDTRVVNVMLPENARLAAIFPPVASELCATLQKLAPPGRTLIDLVGTGVMSKEGRELIESCLATRRNILVAGDGRASQAVLQAIAAAMPRSLRVVSLVDYLQPPEGAAWTRLAPEGRVSDVVLAAASLRPDYLVLEVTAPALAADVLSQCVLGQEGTLVTMAARSAADALQRLCALAGPALGGIAHVRELVASAFDVVIGASTLADGSMRVLEIGEPQVDLGGQIKVTPLIAWEGEGSNGRFRVVGGGPARLPATLAARGAPVPQGLGRK